MRLLFRFVMMYWYGTFSALFMIWIGANPSGWQVYVASFLMGGILQTYLATRIPYEDLFK
jgi:hypothetical protein